MPKDYFKPGDLVTLRQDVPNKPTMVVEKIEKAPQVSGPTSVTGIRCFWFGTDGTMHKNKFNFKDLVGI